MIRSITVSSAVLLTFLRLNVIMLNVVMLGVIMLNVVMLSVIMLNYACCIYAEGRGSKKLLMIILRSFLGQGVP